MIELLPWIAVAVISTGYLAQIWKIHKHKEVRDLSPWAYVAWGIAYLILGYQGLVIEAPVFVLKNIITFILVTIILSQIHIHRNDEWHDDEDKYCKCSNELEPHWKYCPDCGEEIKNIV
jgi:uncharacterized protein with PQ loop repeat